MKTNYFNFFEAVDLLLTKVESIEAKLSIDIQDHKYKEYMCIEELLDYLKEEKAITVSKSKVYKLTGTSGGIPFRKAYNRLVFQKREIDLWIDTQLNPQRNQALARKSKAKVNNSINNSKK